MIVATIPNNESERLQAVQRLQILDSLPEEEYDSITRLASYICHVPVSLITLIEKDRQWFKSKVGTDICETDRDSSFCSHAILNPNQPLVVNDVSKDERFIDNPLTMGENGVSFYAGVPLRDAFGNALGSLCVLDTKPNQLSEEQLKALQQLAAQVEYLFQLRLQNQELMSLKDTLSVHNNLLKDFASTVSHDMKMPLSNIILTSDILRKEYDNVLDERGINYLGYLKKSALSLSDYIGNILDHYESTAYQRDDAEAFELNVLLEDIVELLQIKYDCEVHLPERHLDVKCNRSALEQIFLNLIANSIKYNDKKRIIIEIEASEDDQQYSFSVSDNGMGIEENMLHSIFDLFSTVGHLDREGQKGHGIGLSTVKKLIETLEGTIEATSTVGKGTTFHFTIAK
ncbi:GAF domain-containing sensor histidine kinase [Altibacter sp. HG106]|uniref:GAF domain-containing sensor histidine kinase n=1 Tax=Altibacter sp. HG106 TaxID=3023937 RepID=UPI0023500F4D|nr:GAF domain-containing sensor histidine kinase [Altibacter sp. HG106]MDC7996217.1 GAF domain-containing sensor histidine kinase [Altibacter sp. HG106]